jgi:predicted CopG family antitoxin
MTERKNLKIAPDTYDELREEKRDMETWDSMFRRLMYEQRVSTDELRRLANEMERYQDTHVDRFAAKLRGLIDQ